MYGSLVLLLLSIIEQRVNTHVSTLLNTGITEQENQPRKTIWFFFIFSHFVSINYSTAMNAPSHKRKQFFVNSYKFESWEGMILFRNENDFWKKITMKMMILCFFFHLLITQIFSTKNDVRFKRFLHKRWQWRCNFQYKIIYLW